MKKTKHVFLLPPCRATGSRRRSPPSPAPNSLLFIVVIVLDAPRTAGRGVARSCSEEAGGFPRFHGERLPDACAWKWKRWKRRCAGGGRWRLRRCVFPFSSAIQTLSPSVTRERQRQRRFLPLGSYRGGWARHGWAGPGRAGPDWKGRVTGGLPRQPPSERLHLELPPLPRPATKPQEAPQSSPTPLPSRPLSSCSFRHAPRLNS